MLERGKKEEIHQKPPRECQHPPRIVLVLSTKRKNYPRSHPSIRQRLRFASREEAEQYAQLATKKPFTVQEESKEKRYIMSAKYKENSKPTKKNSTTY